MNLFVHFGVHVQALIGCVYCVDLFTIAVVGQIVSNIWSETFHVSLADPLGRNKIENQK